MKNFFILLAKSVGISLAVSLTVCFLAWYWGNWRAIIWYFLGIMFIWQVYKYFKTPMSCDEIKDNAGNVVYPGRTLSAMDKFDDLIIGIFWIAVGAAGFYAIGWLGEQAIGYSCKYFESTILIGFILIMACLSAYGTVRIIYYIVKELGWKYLKLPIPDIARWISVIGIGIIAGLTVLYYGLPPTI